MQHVSTALVLSIALVVAGCGGEPASQEETVTPYGASPAETPPPSPVPDTPEAIADAVVALYMDTMKKVVSTLEPRPEVEEARSLLASVKEDAIAGMVALGRSRVGLDDAGKATVDRRARMGVTRTPSDLFGAFQEAYKHYMSADRELGNLISGFNIITQYADFELLKKQSPKEYERLNLGE